jgi:putative oxidoreductase
MRKLMTTQYGDTAFNLAMFILRIVVGIAMAFYGYHKLTQFNAMASSDFWNKQVNFLGQGGAISLGLTIFAELVCSLLLIMGLLTRLSLLPLIFCMVYIVVVVDKNELVHAGENGFELNHAFFYFAIYVVLLLVGPGAWSVDKLISKK